MKLATKLTVLFLLLTTIPLTIVGYLAYDNGRRTIEQDTLNHLISTTILKEDEFNRWVENNERRLSALASRPGIREYATVLVSRDPADAEYQAAYRSILEDHLEPNLEEGGFLDLLILRGDDGLIFVSTDSRYEGKYRESTSYFVEGRSHTYVQNVYYSLTRGEATMAIGTPIRGRDGNLVAVLAGHVDLAEMSEIMLQCSGLSASEETYLVNGFNSFVTEPRFGQGYALKKALHTEGVEACLRHNDGVGFYEDYRAVPVIGAYRWMPERELCILTEVDQAEAYAPVVALRNTVFGIGLGVTLIVALASAFFARTITGPVRQLVQGAEEIGRGNLEYRIEVRARDEIGQLAGAFNEMAAKRKGVEQALRESEQRLSTTLRSMGDAMIATDAKGLVTLMNPVARDLTGWDEAEAVGKPLEDVFNIINEQTGERAENPVTRVLREGVVVDLANHTVLIAKDGMKRPIADSGAPMRDEEGNIIGTVMVFRDITERKEMQERLMRQEKLAVLGQLAGGVGHELRNPLGAIKNAAYFLNMALEEPDPEVKETLEILEKEVGTSERIISSLLDFARAKPPTRRKVDVNDTVQEALSRTAVPENVELVRQLDEALPTILADPDQLAQVFGNIILNGIQAMPEGGRLVIKTARLSLRAEPTRLSSSQAQAEDLVEPSGWVTVSFADTGVGIPEENLDKLFEPLFTTKAKGIGLGLALVKTLVEGHGGTIEVQSPSTEFIPSKAEGLGTGEIGKGSTLTVRLPISDRGMRNSPQSEI